MKAERIRSSSGDRLRSVAVVVIFIVGGGLASVARAQVQPQCAGFGGYCQNHWDCCSNTCMSYLYRCTGRYVNVYTPPHSTLEEILELNFGSRGNLRTPVEIQIPVGFFGRFGGAGEVNPDFQLRVELQGPTAAVTTTADTPIRGVPNQEDGSVEAARGDEIISATEREEEQVDMETTTEVEVISTRQATTPTAAPTTAKPTASTAAAKQTSESASVTTTTTTTATPEASVASTKCSGIGSKCYRNEECCTVRCHGFLHQCVT